MSKEDKESGGPVWLWHPEEAPDGKCFPDANDAPKGKGWRDTPPKLKPAAESKEK